MSSEQSNSSLFVRVRDLPHPDWNRVHGWERAEVEAVDAEAFWRGFVAEWLARLAKSLGPTYAVRESANFFVLSAAGEAADRERVAILERIRRRMFGVFGEPLLPKGTVEKHVVLLFANNADYTRYYARYLPDGESAMSGGVCIHTGYVHIAIPGDSSLDAVFAHEFAHNLTFHLPLPPWLNEGVAMYMEGTIGGRSTGLGDEFLDSRSYWNAETIQEYWSGSTFSSVAGQEAAYALAATMFNTIITDVHPSAEALRKFIPASDFRDAGDYASERYLSRPVEDIAAIVLGIGEWKPNPETWPGFRGIEPPAEGPTELDGELDENGFLWPKGMKPDPEPPTPPPPLPGDDPRYLDY